MQEKPDKLPPPPEYWQASATVLGLVALVLEGTFVLTGRSNDLLTQAVLFAAVAVFGVYFVATVSTREYARAPWLAKVQPYVVLLGVMAPLIPAWYMAHLAANMLLLKHFDYRSLIFASAPLVPLFNWLCTYSPVIQREKPRAWLYFINGVALVLSAVCGAFLFTTETNGILPAMVSGMFAGTMAAIALALVFDLQGRSAEAHRDMRSQVGGVAGVLLGFAVFVLPQVSYEFHSVMINCATASNSPSARRAAVRVLRAFGSTDEILRTAYGTNREMVSFVEPYRGDLQSQAKCVFSWVYGASCNDVSPPWDVAFRHFLNGDSDLAGETVGSRSTGVRLDSSTIEAWTDRPTENAMQFEWTMEFANETDSPQEARFVISMPKDGVVSRAVLWVNGMPREALVTSVRQARQAYQDVVLNKRRDPLLVSWVSPDRVMVQCFPVPPRSAQQKIKIELTIDAPVVPIASDRAQMWMPWIAEKNFVSPADGQAVCNMHQDNGVKSIKISEGGMSLTFALPKQNIAAVAHQPLERLDVIVDGGAKLEKHRDAIVNAVSQIRDVKDVRIHFATDELSQTDSDLANGIASLRVAPFLGGPDNTGALCLSIANEDMQQNKHAILWIHGPQPLSPRADLSVASAEIYEVALGGGSNEVTKAFPASKVHTIPVCDGSAKEDIARGVQELCGAKQSWTLAEPCNGSIEALHRAIASADSWHNGDEIAMAAKIVSPYTSAVALESRQQEVEHGLVPEEQSLGWYGGNYGGRSIAIDHSFDTGTDGAEASGVRADLPVRPPVVATGLSAPAPPVRTFYRRDGAPAPSAALQVAQAPSFDEFATPNARERPAAKAGDVEIFDAREAHKTSGTIALPTAIPRAFTPPMVSAGGRGAAVSYAESATKMVIPKPVGAAQPGAVRVVMLMTMIGFAGALIALLFFVITAIRRKWYQRPIAATGLVLAIGLLLLLGSRVGTLIDSVRAFV